MLWNIISIVVGVLTGSMVNMALLLVSGRLWPMPEGLDPNVPDSFAEYVASLPPQALVFIMLAHLAQAGVGGGVAAGLGASHRQALALAVGGITLIGSLISLLTLPAPPWMWAELALVPVAAWYGGKAGAAMLPERTDPA